MQNDYHRWSITGAWICFSILLLSVVFLFFALAKNQLTWVILLISLVSICACSASIIIAWVMNRLRKKPEDYRNVLGWPDIWPSEKKKDSGHYAYPFDKRIAIVEHYFQARKEGEAKNKDIWAKEYGISGKTLGEYIKEYQTEQRLKKATGDTDL